MPATLFPSETAFRSGCRDDARLDDLLGPPRPRPVRAAPPRPMLSPAGLAVARGVRGCSVEQARGPRRLATVQPAPQRGGGGLRLTRRGRLTVLLIVVGVCGVLFSLGRVSAGAAVRTHAPVRTTTVQAGESLWGVASRVAPSVDPRDEIERLAYANGISDEAGLVPGQVLTLPN